MRDMVEEVPAPIDDPAYTWRTGEDGGVLMLRATALGIARASERDEDLGTPAPVRSLAGCSADRTTVQAGAAALTATRSAVDSLADAARTGQAEADHGDPDRGVLTPAPVLSAEAPEAASRPARPAKRTDSLRRAAQALLDAWDNTGDGHGSLGEIIGPITALRAALAITIDGSARPDALRPLRDTKQAQVLAMLARDEGASGPQIAEAMGWASPTVRGFVAGLAKKGITVEVLERVRQVGPNRTGAKGSYTVYRLAIERKG